MFVETKKDGEAQTKISSKDFIAWLRTKNPNEKYDFMNNCGLCAVGQYMAARGIAWDEGKYMEIAITVTNGHENLRAILAVRESHDFGELLRRLLAVRAAK